MPRPISLNSILKEAPAGLNALVQKLTLISALNEKVAPLLPPKLKGKCHLIDISATQLRFAVPHSSLAMQFRFIQGELLSSLRQLPECRGIANLKCVIDTKPIITETQPKPRDFKLSLEQCDALRGLIDKADAPLKKSLERFLAHYK